MRNNVSLFFSLFFCRFQRSASRLLEFSLALLENRWYLNYTAFRNEPRRRFIDGSRRSSNHWSWLEATWDRAMWVTSRRTQSETIEAGGEIKARRTKAVPVLKPQPAASGGIYTRHGSTCILPGTIIISKLYNELGHSTRSSVASLRRNWRRPDIDVDILLCRRRRTINGRSPEPSLLSHSLTHFHVCERSDRRLNTLSRCADARVYFKMTRRDFITDSVSVAYYSSMIPMLFISIIVVSLTIRKCHLWDNNGERICDFVSESSMIFGTLILNS